VREVTQSNELVVFVLDDQKYALPLDVVDRVVRAVEITPLPDAPPIVAGVINVQGRILPVVDLRRRFHLAERANHPDDHFLVAKSSTMMVALPVDEALGMVKDLGDERISADDVSPNLNYVEHVVPHDGEMVFALDIDTVLTDDEEEALGETIGESESPTE
jgi:purine-binding chemotaxis protein CheW